MKIQIFKTFFSCMFQCSLTYMSIICFIIALFVPNINSYIIKLSLAWFVFCIFIFFSIIHAFFKTASKYNKKTFKFIEIKKTEQDNNIYWFTSDYFFNIGDTIKLIEYNDTGTFTNICIAKVHQKSETMQIGLLPILILQNIDLLQNQNCKIKPVHINIDDITQISKHLTNTINAEVNYEQRT